VLVAGAITGAAADTFVARAVVWRTPASIRGGDSRLFL